MVRTGGPRALIYASHLTVPIIITISIAAERRRNLAYGR